jgi:anthranilate synthase/aminodeoxychorismate synthase-like glutamine amidotransferase
MSARILMVDNRDSFTFNLVDELERRGASVTTIRGDAPLEAMHARMKTLRPHAVLLSPGPGHPEDAGLMVPWLRSEPAVPVLGVCLGHQAMGVAFGGKVGRAPEPVHGKAEAIDLEEDGLFRTLPARIPVARYHSLAVTVMPETFRVIASLAHGPSRLCMAMRHRTKLRVGFQFHPESVLTPHGSTLLAHFVDEALALGMEGFDR